MSKQQVTVFKDAGLDNEDTIKIALWAVWRTRIELTLIAATGGAWYLLAPKLGQVPAALIAAAPWALTLTIGRTRRALLAILHTGDVRRRWARACLDAGIVEPPARRSRRREDVGGPRVRQVRRTAAGDILTVRCVGTSTPALIEQKREELAVKMKVRQVRVQAIGTRNRAHITLIRRDPFDDATPLTWPLLTATRTNLWDPVPVGIDEEGHPVTISLPERNLLIGGEPGAGKSVAMNVLCAHAALDPDSRLWLFDGKQGVELYPWRNSAECFVGSEPDRTQLARQACTELDRIRTGMDQRYRQLLDRNARKVTRDMGLPLHLVIIDELAFYLNQMPTPQAKQFKEGLRDLIARGRAAGIIVVAATQKPDAETIDSAIRDLMSYRWALRCTTPQASDTVLGQGQASTGANAAQIPTEQRGVGYILAEGDRAKRVRGYYLSDQDVDRVAERTNPRNGLGISPTPE